MKINVNHQTRVVLNERGARVINDRNMKYHVSRNSEMDEKCFPTSYKNGDVFEGPIWEIMQIWGPHMMIGAEAMFEENEIEITGYEV